MDEFDIYLARAYGGGQLTSARPQADSDAASPGSRDRLGLHPGHKPGRRHSSVGVHCSADFYTDACSLSDHSSKAGQRKHELTGNGATSASKRKLSSTVTVAVEPPSPTELRHSHLPAREHHCQKTGRSNGVENGSSADDSGEDQHNDVGEDTTNPKQFSRSRTAPIQRRAISADSTGSNATAPGHHQYVVDQNASVNDERNSDAEAEATANTPAVNRNDSATSSVRPDKLLLNAPPGDGGIPIVTIGSASPGLSRRRSTTCTPETQLLTIGSQPSPGTLRRNSCIGAVSSTNNLRPPHINSGGSPSTSANSPSAPAASPGLVPASRSGRRNSAITYLNDSTGLLAAPGRCSPRPGGSTVGLRPDERRSFSADGAIVDPAQLQALLQLAARGRSDDADNASPDAGVSRLSGSTAVTSLQSVTERHVIRVAVIGAHEVGKSTLTDQLLTSEYLANKENYQGKTTEMLLFSFF
jgi:hypothetical protein